MRKQQKCTIVIPYLKNLADLSLAMLIFWSSESIPVKVMTISTLLDPKMEKLIISPQSHILTQISHFGLWTCYSRSYLSNKTNISVNFGSCFKTQFPWDPAMMPTLQSIHVN